MAQFLQNGPRGEADAHAQWLGGLLGLALAGEPLERVGECRQRLGRGPKARHQDDLMLSLQNCWQQLLRVDGGSCAQSEGLHG